MKACQRYLIANRELTCKRDVKSMVEREVGIPVTVGIVGEKKTVVSGELKLLTSSIIERMKVIKKTFMERCPSFTITKIEYIINPSLYSAFHTARAELRDRLRPSEEVVLFHGTRRRNINRCRVFKNYLISG